jgi:hypothetical protein
MKHRVEVRTSARSELLVDEVERQPAAAEPVPVAVAVADCLALSRNSTEGAKIPQ